MVVPNTHPFPASQLQWWSLTPILSQPVSYSGGPYPPPPPPFLSQSVTVVVPTPHPLSLSQSATVVVPNTYPFPASRGEGRVPAPWLLASEAGGGAGPSMAAPSLCVTAASGLWGEGESPLTQPLPLPLEEWFWGPDINICCPFGPLKQNWCVIWTAVDPIRGANKQCG